MNQTYDDAIASLKERGTNASDEAGTAEYRDWLCKINEPECTDYYAQKDVPGTAYGITIYAPTPEILLDIIDCIEDADARKMHTDQKIILNISRR